MKQAAILVIDDDPGNLLRLQEILETESYIVATAASGDAALQLLQEHTFDLTLTDLAMPGTAGMEVLYYLHQHQPDCPASSPPAMAASAAP